MHFHMSICLYEMVSFYAHALKGRRLDKRQISFTARAAIYANFSAERLDGSIAMGDSEGDAAMLQLCSIIMHKPDGSFTKAR